MTRLALLLALSLSACGPSGAAPEPTPEPTPVETPAPTPEIVEADCGQLVADYLAARDALNRCEEDADCAMFWPGVCPHGAWFGHVRSDFADLDAAIDALTSSCVLPECEPPRRPAMPLCRDGGCVEGRAPPMSNALTSCWDTRVTWLAAGRTAVGDSYPHLQGITPLFGIGVATPGRLRVLADVGCEDCELLVSGGNPGMGSPVEGRPFTPMRKVDPARHGRWLMLEYDVDAEPHYLAVIGGDQASLRLHVELLDPHGEAMAADRRGVTWLRTCED